MNPIINQLQLNPSQIKQIWQNIQSFGSPQALVNNVLNNNPQLKSMLQYNSPKEAYYALAKEKGIDPDYILKLLK